MIWYRCANCKTDTNSADLTKDICPVCGGNELYQVDYCTFCEHCFDVEDGEIQVYSGLCEDCLKELAKNPDIGLAYINSDRQMMVDFYIGYQFQTETENTSTELIEVCEREFKEAMLSWPLIRDEALKGMQEFILFDISHFAEWYGNYHNQKVNGAYDGDRDREPENLIDEE